MLHTRRLTICFVFAEKPRVNSDSSYFLLNKSTKTFFIVVNHMYDFNKINKRVTGGSYQNYTNNLRILQKRKNFETALYDLVKFPL